MVVSKEILTDYKEAYERAIKLVNEESKNDPPTDPYRSHYEAQKVLLDMMQNLKNSLVSVQAEELDNDEDDFTFKVILAFVYRDLGRIYIFTEEPPTGEKYLRQCIELLEQHKLRAEAIIPYVGAFNEMGIVRANREDYTGAFEQLQQSELAYRQFKQSGLDAFAITDVFGTREEIETGKGNAELEGLYTLCCFYMAQVFGHLGDLAKSAWYCNNTLRRQLQAKTFDAIDFALNAATLSQYYIGVNKFREARHHLAAATHIMAEHKKHMLTDDMTEQQCADVEETYKHRYADVARCWAKYGLVLLEASRERLLNDDSTKIVNDTKNLSVSDGEYQFAGLDLCNIEKRIRTDYCLTFEDAKPVFHFVNKSLEEAKEYYTADSEATEYAKIIMDFAELYKLIAFFEEDGENQAKMHKRRAKYLEDLLELLNPTFYLAICRQCWYEAALASSMILDIRMDALKAVNTASAQEIQKYNQICNKTVQHFNSFVQSYTEQNGNTLKPISDTEEAYSVLYALFHLGRLHYKFISANPDLQLQNLRNSLQYYKKFLAECETRPETAQQLQAEIGVSREMAQLLPMKIAVLEQRAAATVAAKTP